MTLSRRRNRPQPAFVTIVALASDPSMNRIIVFAMDETAFSGHLRPSPSLSQPLLRTELPLSRWTKLPSSGIFDHRCLCLSPFDERNCRYRDGRNYLHQAFATITPPVSAFTANGFTALAMDETVFSSICDHRCQTSCRKRSISACVVILKFFSSPGIIAMSIPAITAGSVDPLIFMTCSSEREKHAS